MSTLKWIVVSVSVLLLVIGLWILMGFLPQRICGNLTDAAAYGESFGLANSLFASLALAFVALTLILQMSQIRANALTQTEQGRLQLEQVRIAERTTRIQEAMRLDAHRRMAMDAFLKINRDTVTFKHAFVAWHPASNPSRGPHFINQEDQDTGRRLKKEYFDAYTALRSNCLGIGLIFGRRGDVLGRAIQDLYAMTDAWFSNIPPVVECENKMNQQIQFIEREMQPLWSSLSDESTIANEERGQQ